MRIISFNINGLRARLHQLEALIDKHQPDIIGLQEIKVHDDAFPREAVEALGYRVYHFGQKAHYGVAILCKQEPLAVRYGFPTDDDDAQRRMIMASFAQENGRTLHLLNGYFPQGESQDHPVKFPAKQKFYADLQQFITEHHTPDQDIAIIGDVNIAPLDADIGIGPQNAKRWLRTGKCSFLPQERSWMETLLGWGLHDTFRLCHPDVTDQYSWFDYRSKGFNDNRGLRIDLILASAPLAKRCTDAGIDYPLRGIEKPSDHAPIYADFTS